MNAPANSPNMAVLNAGSLAFVTPSSSTKYAMSHNNPVDIIGDATPERYAKVIEACVHDKNSDNLLVILTPQAMTNPLAVAETVIKISQNNRRTLVACWMGGDAVASSHEAFRSAAIPCFHTPGIAVEVLSYLSKLSSYVERMSKDDNAIPYDTQRVAQAEALLQKVRYDGRSALTIEEANALLTLYRIPVVGAKIARTQLELMQVAEIVGYPLAMKISSPDILHKMDIGGVRLDVKNGDEAAHHFQQMLDNAKRLRPNAKISGVSLEPMVAKIFGRELIVGLKRDAVFGPVIAFGAGGSAVEIFNDKAIELPPLDLPRIRDMISRTKISKMLHAYRGRPAINFKALEDVLLGVSQMACELPWLEEVDLNPAIIDENEVLVVDAKIIVAIRPPSLRRFDHLALSTL